MSKPQLEPEVEIIKIYNSKDRTYGVTLNDKEHIEVAPGIYQSLEDYEANMAYDKARDEELLDELSK